MNWPWTRLGWIEFGWNGSEWIRRMPKWLHGTSRLGLRTGLGIVDRNFGDGADLIQTGQPLFGHENKFDPHAICNPGVQNYFVAN